MEQTYASAGVDVLKAEAFVDRLKKVSTRPAHQKLWRGAGGYASVVPISGSYAMALSTDGVGTKLLVACELENLETIGIDLVAMCVNDLICVGARPTAFLDYYATSKLVDESADAIIKGIVEGCDQAGIILVGGETAEVPDLYQEKHFDLAGFAVGMVDHNQLLTGEKVAPGDVLIGVASSGIHSNGLSLARKVVDKEKWAELLTPTTIYVQPALEILERARELDLRGMANITGGGWRNLLRLNEKVGFEIDRPLPEPGIFAEFEGHATKEELFRTFNMGMGFAVIATEDSAGNIVNIFKKHSIEAAVVGKVNNEAGKIKIHRKNKDGETTVFTIEK